ncbi:MAG: SRPBCC family protein [Acidimicrobiaceae bacterium]|nr:SRPBCC family protein [Acidimicrobiaceae bacterium]
MASLRHERRIKASVEEVWDVVKRPESIPTWFPGIVSCTVDGDVRVIRTVTGLEMPERIMTIDSSIHRFAYRITSPLYRFHLGVIDVIEIGPRDSLCVYSTTAVPDALALIIAGGTHGALLEIQRIAESHSQEA